MGKSIKHATIKDILDLYKPSHTCENCKWFDRDRLYGDCSNAIANEYGVERPHKDFGCNQWEAK